MHPLYLNYMALKTAIVTNMSAQEAITLMGLYEIEGLISAEEKKKRNIEILRRHKAGQSAKQISEEMEIHRQTVHNCLRSVKT